MTNLFTGLPRLSADKLAMTFSVFGIDDATKPDKPRDDDDIGGDVYKYLISGITAKWQYN